MPTDVDKILEELKEKRKKENENSAGDTLPVKDEESENKPKKEITNKEKYPDSPVPAMADGDSGRLNLEPAEVGKNDMVVDRQEGTITQNGEKINEDTAEVKRSEDYLDDEFKKFFTQSVIITKSPQQVDGVEIKRKKRSFFRKKYITDSLSLNIDQVEETTRKIDIDADKKEEKNLPGNTDAEGKNFEIEQTSDEKPRRVKSVTTQRKPIDADKILNNPEDFDKLIRDILSKKPSSRQRDTSEMLRVDEKTKKAETPVQNFATVQTASGKQTVVGTKEGIVDDIYKSIMEGNKKGNKPAEYTDETAYVPILTDTQPLQDENGKTESEVSRENVTTESRRLKDTLQLESSERAQTEKYVTSSEFFTKIDGKNRDITEELIDFKHMLTFRTVVGLVCGALLTYFNLAISMTLPLPSAISPNLKPVMFYIVATVIYAVALAVFFPTVLSGFAAMKKAPSQDSLVSLAGVACALQLVVLIIYSAKGGAKDYTIFAAFGGFLLAFNAIGKNIATATIIKNLTLTNAPKGINAGFIVEDEEAVKILARTLDERVPKILTTRKTSKITDVVKFGFAIHPSDYKARKLAVVNYFVSGLCMILGGVATKSALGAISALAGASCIMAPLSHSMIGSLPSALMQKNLERRGALVNGWKGVEQLAQTTHVNFDAKHLFPQGNVILHGIKTFERERIDLAIIYAASVLIENCRVLRPVFMEVIEGRTNILYPVKNCEYYEKQGYVAWVENARVILGNRSLMEKYDINMPPLSLENRFTTEGRKPIYLAVGGKLFGMFLVSYTANESVKQSINHLIEKGVSIILSTDDFNIDSDLVEKVYGVPKDCISVVNQKEAELLSKSTSFVPQTNACLAHLDSLYSLVAGFYGAHSAKSAEKQCSIIQTVAVLAGAAMSLAFTYSSTIFNLPITSMLLMGLTLAGVTMVAAFLKRYTI
jgi:hypothetical protein